MRRESKPAICLDCGWKGKRVFRSGRNPFLCIRCSGAHVVPNGGNIQVPRIKGFELEQLNQQNEAKQRRKMDSLVREAKRIL